MSFTVDEMKEGEVYKTYAATGKNLGRMRIVKITPHYLFITPHFNPDKPKKISKKTVQEKLRIGLWG